MKWRTSTPDGKPDTTHTIRRSQTSNSVAKITKAKHLQKEGELLSVVRIFPKAAQEKGTDAPSGADPRAGSVVAHCSRYVGKRRRVIPE
ncbi:hypothetical protein [Streptomyces sp900105755]|uniref:Uncharacterized protein n=1 Tax=Streptomyces sp. 900105755 TaxID=3154389 RepID=A0ABV1TJY3_9ACTN